MVIGGIINCIYLSKTFNLFKPSGSKSDTSSLSQVGKNPKMFFG